MILAALFLLLGLNFVFHIYSLVLFIQTKENRYIRWFANTAIANIAFAGIITIFVIYNPAVLRGVNLGRFMWVLSGVIMFIMLYIKIAIFRRMYARAHDPANYHFNYFGKKVLNQNVMTKNEIYVFYGTIPAFLIFGAYFIMKLINYLLFGFEI